MPAVSARDRRLSRLRPLNSDSPVCVADVNDTALPLPSALPPGTTREQLLARFHVRGRDGALLSGAQAFLALWAALPGWRWLALALPLVHKNSWTNFLAQPIFRNGSTKPNQADSVSASGD